MKWENFVAALLYWPSLALNGLIWASSVAARTVAWIVRGDK